MIVLAILSTLAAIVCTFLVVMANGMSDSPSTPFQFGWMIWGVWLLAAALWLGWWVG